MLKGIKAVFCLILLLIVQLLFMIQAAHAEALNPDKYIIVFENQDLSESGITKLASGGDRFLA